MLKGVTEYPSVDVLQRKYQDTVTIFEHSQTGELFQAFVRDFSQSDKGFIFLDHGGHPVPGLPVYWPFESGYYVNRYGEVYLLERRFSSHKHFQVGLSGKAWALFKVNTGTGNRSERYIDTAELVNFIAPHDKTKFLTRGIGALNRRYMLGSHSIFYKGNVIGARQQEKIVLDNELFKPDLKQVLGPSWRVL